MMGWMTYGTKKFEALDSKMRKNIPPLYAQMKQLISMIDADTNAFNDYMIAMKMPKNTAEEKALREEKMQEGIKKAIEVPLKVMRLGDECWQWMFEMAKVGNMSSRSDLEVGAKNLESGIWGAHRNVLINLPQIKDEAYKTNVLKEAEEIMERAEKGLKKVVKVLAGR